TLVDRIVTGHPKDELAALTAALGYHDELLDAGEIFHSWVIESRANLAGEFPLTQAGLNVVWTSNMTPYRDRKVRILNGAHTMLALPAYLAGKNTVRECMGDEAIRTYVEKAIHEEIIPTLDLPKDDLLRFAASVMERFANPHITHYLLSIALNSTSKYRARVLPSVLAFQKRTGSLPSRLCFGLAALIAFYRGENFQQGALIGTRRQEQYRIVDDRPVLDFFAGVWRAHASSNDVRTLVTSILANTAMWGQDLNALPGMTDAILVALTAILDKGVILAIQNMA
ncbi:MAG TPA: tagaturonate reductase, partial [Candidatus Methylomirabilis sp.]|nr:tagaturonate reductase [Candidatus Methylomirabilis sp.]